MIPRRALLLVAMFAAAPLAPAIAQFGPPPPGMTGAPAPMPGMPGMGGPSMGGGYAPPQQQQQPPAACQGLLTLRDEVQKAGVAIRKASERRATPVEACKLFKNLLAGQVKLIKGVEQNMTTCGVPPDVPQQMRAEQAQITKVAKNICDAAARGPQQAGPTLSDALGTSRSPDRSSATGRGTLDTLTGNPLAR
jgi:hypothetical protein